ncbi:MAG: sialidase family protein [Acidobacteriota bacterium]
MRAPGLRGAIAAAVVVATGWITGGCGAQQGEGVDPGSTAGPPPVRTAAERRALVESYREQIRRSPDRACRLGRVLGDAEIGFGPQGESLIASAGLQWLRPQGSPPPIRRKLGPTSWWPALGVDGRRVLLAAGVVGKRGSRAEPHKLVLLESNNLGETFDRPRLIERSKRWLIDPELLKLRNGMWLLFFTEVNGEANSNRATYTVRLFASVDDGKSWKQRARPLRGPKGVNIEDAQAVEVEDGTVLLVYEHETKDRGASTLRQIRSTDRGKTWSKPTTVWDDVPGADVEPGGYLRFDDGELWLVASTDEDAVGGSYGRAVVKRKVSRDGGKTWGDKKTLIDLQDQIALQAFETPSGKVGLLTLRFYGDFEAESFRTLYRYHLDRDAPPGVFECTVEEVFASGFEDGGLEAWSVVKPGTAKGPANQEPAPKASETEAPETNGEADPAGSGEGGEGGR